LWTIAMLIYLNTNGFLMENMLVGTLKEMPILLDLYFYITVSLVIL